MATSSIGSLKVITILALLRIPLAPSTGFVGVTDGAVQSPALAAHSPSDPQVWCCVPEHRVPPGLQEPPQVPAVHTKGQGASVSHCPSMHTSGVLLAPHFLVPAVQQGLRESNRKGCEPNRCVGSVGAFLRPEVGKNARSKLVCAG